MSFIPEAILIDRLTDNGVKWAADRDNSGTVEAEEKTRYLTLSRSYADRLILEALDPWMPQDYALAVAVGNEWLQDRGMDLAVYQGCTIGGRNATDSVKLARDDAISRLDDVRTGAIKVPGLIYPVVGDSQQRAGRVRACNVETKQQQAQRSARRWRF